MAATQYQIFFRYVNPASNVAITNDLINDYEETVEIIHSKHKLECGTSQEKADAEQEINNMIIEANSPSLCNKYDMIFVYDGIKKFYHRNWTQADPVTGVEGHYSSDITLMPSGIVVRKRYDLDDILEDVIPDGYGPSTTEETTSTTTDGDDDGDDGDNGGDDGGDDGEETVDVASDTADLVTSDLLDTLNTNRVTSVTDLREREYNMVPNYLKPETYIARDQSQYPYVIKDNYKRVPMSPWIKGSVFGSLEAAIEKCKVLTKAIGLNNVMLIKTVAIRQRIKLN